VAASVVEFFPATVDGLGSGWSPDSLDELVARYPYFEPEPVLELKAGRMPEFANPAKSTRLFRQLAVPTHYPVRLEGRLRRLLGRSHPRATTRLKTPLVLRSDTSFATDAHRANIPPATTVLLTAIHFVFTGQLREKSERVIEWGTHSRDSGRYRDYLKLLERLEATGTPLLSAQSVGFESADQFIDCGLMRW
jgi:hypothetical protein